MENYGVKYNIQVIADPAVEAIAKFARVTDNLNIASTKFRNLQNTVESLNASLNKFKTQKAPVVQIKTAKAQENISKLINKVDQLKTKLNQLGLTSFSSARSWAANAPLPPTPLGPTPAKQKLPKQKAAPPATQSKPTRRNIGPNRSALSYRALGPAMIDSGGIGAISLMKGMGVAYGISAIGSLASSVVKDASEYDNLMQSTRNILEAHDKQGGFDQRFSEMEKTVRQVGVETKFTAPQVADASKFLAMAGFNLDAINKSIRPIADIALVGDTDLGETADVVTNIMTGYNIAPEKVRKAADIMTMTFTKSNTTLMELAEAYKYAASLLSAGGISFEESTAGLGVLGDAGIKGSQAGTTMRTIMANIVNPTKKQAAEWERVGVKRLDENGNARDLVDIFGDLASKNLNVSSFYKMFHKTAAMGAVALANHVDKWNEIVELNFMSEGMVGDLAEKKKNAIQGLWAQLTSMFTEGGMQAFEAMKPEIKEMLSDGVAFFKSEETIEKIKTTAQALLDLVKTIIKITGVFYNFWEKYQGFIMGWLKLQLVLSAVLVPLRAMKGLMNFGKYAISSIGAVGMMTRQVGAFTGAVRQATFAKSAFNQTVMTGGAYGVPAGSYGLVTRAPSLANWFNVSATKYTTSADQIEKRRIERLLNSSKSQVGVNAIAARYNQMFGKIISAEEVAARRVKSQYSSTPQQTADRYNRIYSQQIEANRKTNWANFKMQGTQMMTGAGTMLGGMGGSYLLSQLSNGNPFWTILGGAGGAALGLLGPWGLVGGAILSAVGYAIDLNNQTKKNTEEAKKLCDQFRIQNGLVQGDGTSDLVKALNAVQEKEKTINDLIQERIAMRKEEIGLASNNSKIFDGSIANSLLEKLNNSGLSALFDAANGSDKIIKKKDLGASGKLFDTGSPSTWGWRTVDGGELSLDTGQAKVAVAMRAQGASRANALQEEYMTDIHKNLALGALTDVKSLFVNYDKNVYDFYGNAAPGSNSWNVAGYNKQTDEAKSKNFYYLEAIREGTSGNFAQGAQFRNDISRYINEQESGKLTQEAVLNVMRYYDEIVKDYINIYFTDGITGILESLNFKDGQFVDPLSGLPSLKETERAKAAFERIKNLLNSFGGQAMAAATNFLNDIESQLNMTIGQIGAWGGKGVADANLPTGKSIVNGVEYEYDKTTGRYIDVKHPSISLSPAEFSAAYKNRNKNALDLLADNPDDPNNPGGKTPPPLGSTGIDQSNYKTHYGNGSAAPRQIIIKIDKMLSIDKIDMANKDKAEIAALVEEYVTPGLINALSNATAAINANPTT